MLIDEQIEQVRDWVRRGGPALFDRYADIESEALWRTVRSIDPGTASKHLAQQLDEAHIQLGWFHYLRHQARRDPVDLAKAVVCLEVVADDHRLVPPRLEDVVGRFTDPEQQARVGAELLTASLSNTEEALLDAGIQLVTPAAGERPDQLSSLCLAYRRRYERTGSTSDLDHAIETGEQAVALAPEVETWARLAEAHRCRYMSSADVQDLRRVIDLLDRVARVDSGVRSRLGTAYRLLYDRTGDVEALDKAVIYGEQGADPAELGITLLRRFERGGSLPDLLRAAELVDTESTVDVAGVVEVAAVFLTKHEYGGDPADLDHAVRLGQGALDTLRDDHPCRPDTLRAVAVALHRRYLSSGAEADLEKATTLAKWAHAAFPRHQPGFAQATIDLAVIHLTRHARTGVFAELERAVELAESIVTDGCAPEWAATLGRALTTRYLVTRAVPDLDRAIELGIRAVSETTTTTDAARPRRLTDLATAYRTRYGASADLADLNQAVALGTEAVSGTPDRHVDLPWRLSALAEAHLNRYRVDGDTTDLDAAVELSERAWRLAGSEHPKRVRLAAAVATALLARVEGGEQVKPDLLDQLVQDVTESSSAAPVDQVAGQHAVGDLALAAGKAKLATPVLDAAVALLPSLPPREAGWTDRQQRVGEQLGLVEAAVSAHCAIGDPAGGVEIAELGRGILLADEANTRIDLAELSERQPRLADRFEWVCERLNMPDFPADERKRWWSDYAGRLAEIRAVPGFEEFLAAPRLDDMRPAGGTAVLVNTDRHGGHAILVHPDSDPVQVALPDLHDVDDRVRVLLDVVSDVSYAGRLRKRRVIPDVLAWLWDAVVGPVVEALPSTETPHRVWWVPTGVLGLLPLHAAGHPGQPGALDTLVSSFIPSLRALRNARQRPPAQVRRGLVVAMQRTAGQRDLPGAADEAASLPGRRLQDTDAGADSVRAALTSSTWAHFACHAVADPVSPAEGGLLLHDRTLRLPEIGGLRLAEAELAYLSACSTANYGVRHADEVLHLASAFQLAGFRHVVATLWPLGDTIATEAAQAFYHHLPDSPVADSAATVLHRVIRDLRDSCPHRPDVWAALVHSGP